MDIAAWLDGLGLGQYEQAFRDNEIDARILPSLTAEDLKDLGAKLVGHRRRILDAIAALGTSVPVTTRGLACCWRERRRQPLRGIALGSDAPSWPGRGARPAAAPVGARQGGRRPGRADLGRAGHWQISADRGVIRAYRRRAAHAAALLLFAAPPGQCPVPVHRPARTRCRFRPRRYG